MSKDETKINLEMLLQPSRDESSLSFKSSIPDMNAEPYCDLEGEEKNDEIVNTVQKQTSREAHNASYDVPKLLYELEVEIFARVPCFEYWKIMCLNKLFMQLLKSGEIFRVRQKRGLVKPYVCMYSGGFCPWSIFDLDFENFRKLPDIPSDICFSLSTKETLSVGTQLLVIGRDVETAVVWRYELELHKWFKGHSMITPRAMFGSASRGSDAFLAGGYKMDEKWTYEVLSSAEKYNADTKMWTMIQGMHKRRKFTSGCFLNGKFYILGGRDENDNHLKCGESYDEKTDSWELIPDMLGDITFMLPQSPPLIAVVNGNLYLLETLLSQLRVYNIKTNSWKNLGIVPVRTNEAYGWGVAFQSIGDKLLVIGPSASRSWHRAIAVHMCRPSPNAEQQIWELVKYGSSFVERHNFIHNCCVMFA